MLEFNRGDIVEFKNHISREIREIHEYVGFGSEVIRIVNKIHMTLNGNPDKIKLNGELINLNYVRNDLKSFSTPFGNSIEFFVYDDDEYRYIKEVLGFDVHSFNATRVLVPREHYRKNISRENPVFSLVQELHDSAIVDDLHEFLSKNNFKFNRGNHAYLTDIHFHDPREYARFKLLSNEYSSILSYFNPYVNPGYFKQLFGDAKYGY